MKISKEFFNFLSRRVSTIHTYPSNDSLPQDPQPILAAPPVPSIETEEKDDDDDDADEQIEDPPPPTSNQVEFRTFFFLHR